MEWTSDVAAGDWIRERLDEEWTIHHLVPRGFEAYARVFHPVYRERPVDAPWPAEADTAAWEALEGAEIDTESVTWQQVADTFGTTMHPLASWTALTGGDPDGWRAPAMPVASDGWRYQGPEEGGIEPGVLAALAPHLIAATTTPDDGYVAVWEGWGGLVGAMTRNPVGGVSSASFGDTRHDSVMYASVKDVFNDVFRRKRWTPGILSDEISRGPRLSLPDRDHVLFTEAPRSLAEPSWIEAVPWREQEGRGRWSPPPSLVWPADRAWIATGDVDSDSTVLAGSKDLIRSLCADPRIEAAEIPEGASLFPGADPVNWAGRPSAP